MYFTREPIIETIISSREGFKLIIRNSKNVGVEDFSVESVEVISFGQALFFRSMEKGGDFLLPVSDYEIVEMKKNKTMVKYSAIKCGEVIMQKTKKDTKNNVENDENSIPEDLGDDEESKVPSDSVFKRREKGRLRRKRVSAAIKSSANDSAKTIDNDEKLENDEENKKKTISNNMLIPPPVNLIFGNVFCETVDSNSNSDSKDSKDDEVIIIKEIDSTNEKSLQEVTQEAEKCEVKEIDSPDEKCEEISDGSK